MSTKKLYEFTLNSCNAKRIERRHRDINTLRWIGATSFETRQMFLIDGEPEIVLEIAANLEIENVKHIGTFNYNNVNDNIQDVIETTHNTDVNNSNVGIYIFVDGQFEVTTYDYESKSAALKDFRSMDCYKGYKVTALISNYYNDMKVTR